MTHFLMLMFLEHEFLPPKVHFYFYAGVPSKISSILTRLGVTVHGEIQDFPEFEIDDETESEDEDFGKYTFLQRLKYSSLFWENRVNFGCL